MRLLLGIVVVAAVLSAGVIAESYKETDHPCTHPGMDKCPGSSVEQALHCVSCTDPNHVKGCTCVMNYPCGRGEREDAYCTPVPKY
jgi:hypothetical protein